MDNAVCAEQPGPAGTKLAQQHANKNTLLFSGAVSIN